MSSRRHVSWSTNLSVESSSQSSSITALASGSKARGSVPMGGKLTPLLKKPSIVPRLPSSPPPPSQPPEGPRSAVPAELAAETSAKDAQELKNSRDEKEGWRMHGKLFRARLISNDDQSGGNIFVLSNSCSIERYYEVAEKVLDQFIRHFNDAEAEITESYLVGHRLVKYLSTVLPTHVHYFREDKKHETLRARSQEQLVQLLQYMEQLALIIDEDEHHKYILKDLKIKAERTSKNLSVDTRQLPDLPSSPTIASDESFTSNLSSQIVGGVSSSISSDTMNTTFETTLSTPSVSQADVIDIDFFASWDRPSLSQREESDAWGTMPLFNDQTNPIQYSSDNSPIVQKASLFHACGEWEPAFPLSSSEDLQSPEMKFTSETSEQSQGSNAQQSAGATPTTRNQVLPKLPSHFWQGTEAIERESSPKSVMELREWVAEDQLVGFTKFPFQSVDSDGVISTATVDEEDLSLTSLTASKNRRWNKTQLSKFKGCVRCLLE